MKKLFSLIMVFATIFTLSACGEEVNENLENLEQAKTSLILNDLSNVTGDLDLPETGRNGVEITWESSNTDVLSNDGVVDRPGKADGNVKVTLTATLTLGEDSMTKDFEARVIAANWDKFATLREAIEAEDTIGDGEVYIEELTVIATHKDGYIVTDGTASANIYKGPLYETLQVGDVITLGANFSFYYGQNNFSYPGFVRLQDDAGMEIEFAPITIAEIMDFDTVIPMELSGAPIELTGTVELVGPYNNVHISNDDGTINVYYKSDSASQDALKDMVGKEVVVSAILYAYHSGDKVYQIVVDDSLPALIEVEKPTEEKIDLNENAIEKNLPEVSEEDVTLPSTTAYGQEITWTSDDFTITDGIVVAPEVAKSGSIKGTYTIEDQTVEITVTIALGSLTEMDIATAKAEVDGTLVKVKGIISGLNSYGKGVFLQNADGEAIYVSFVDMPEVNPGDEIIVVGSLTLSDSYGNYVREIEGSTLKDVVSNDNTVFVEEMTIADATSDVKVTLSRRVKMTLVVDYKDDFGYTFFKDSTLATDAMTVKINPGHNGLSDDDFVVGETVVIEANLQKVSYDDIVLYDTKLAE